MRLDCRDKFPSGMEEYLSFNSWHFNKKMCDWAVSKMYKIANGVKTPIAILTKEQVDAILQKHNIKLMQNKGYDYVYIANMCRADYMGSSIEDETHMAKFIKDYIEDPDAYDGMPFTRFYADCIGSGTPIPWADLL